jgi:predicted dehydrogenase
MANQDALKVAIVGLRHGHMGSIGPAKPGLIHMYQYLDEFEVVAYCEETDTSLLDPAKEFDAEAGVYTSLDDMIANEDFDLACVAMPANEIPPTGIKLAEAGKHFFMEKQFARTSADLAEMVRAVHENDVKVLVGYPHRYHPVAQDIKRLIDEGVLGRPLDIEVRLITGQVRPENRDPTGFMYRDATEGGGILHMLGGHYLEVMRFLMGCEVKAVQAMAGRPVGIIEPPLEDVAIAAFEFENGAYGSIHAGYLQRVRSAYDTSLVLRGLDGEADWTPIGDPHLTVKSGVPEWAGAPTKTFQYEVAEVDVPMYGPTEWSLDILRDFAACIREGRQPDVNGDVGLYVLQVIDAVYESARTGQRVEVEYGV